MPSLDVVFTFNMLLRCAGAFAALMLIHVLVWRIFKVRKQILWLFLIFLGLPTLAFIGGLVWGAEPISWVLGCLLEFTLSCCYILFFPAIQNESPTLTMLRYLDRNKGIGGLSRDEIMATMCTDHPLQDRIMDLQNNGLIRASGGPQKLSGPGRLVAAFFFYYRRAMGLPCGEG